MNSTEDLLSSFVVRANSKAPAKRIHLTVNLSQSQPFANIWNVTISLNSQGKVGLACISPENQKKR